MRYIYRCDDGHVVEVEHPVTSVLEGCPECGAPCNKVYQPVGISFKGDGFYSTDAR